MIRDTSEAFMDGSVYWVSSWVGAPADDSDAFGVER